MKKLVSVLLAIVVLWGLAGCKAASNDENLISKAHRSRDETPSAVETEPDAFRILNNNRMNCATENGYYYLTNDVIRLKDGAFAHQMMYIDYDLKKEIYLCNRPGCGHDTTECPAVFTEKEVDMGGSLFVHEDFLYLFSHEQDREGVSFNQSNETGGPIQEGAPEFGGTAALLYRMKLDGTERKLVYSFDSTLSLEDIVLGGKQTLYFVTKKLTSGQVDNQIGYVSSTERTLVQLETKKWKMDAVCQMEPETKIIGTFAGNLITSQILFDHELSKEEEYNEDAYLAAYKQSETQLSIFNISSGGTEVLLKLPNKNLNSFAVHNGVLYGSTEGEGHIWQMDLKTKNKTNFVESNASLIQFAHQDVLQCSEWEQKSGEAYLSSFIIFSSGKIGHSNLVTASMKSPIEIRAEAQDYFLVIYDVDATIDTAYDNGQYSINGYKYALLAKEDLYQGQGNYQPIEMIGFGE